MTDDEKDLAQNWLDGLFECASELYDEYGFSDGLFGLAMIADCMFDACVQERDNVSAEHFRKVKTILENASAEIEQLTMGDNVTWH